MTTEDVLHAIVIETRSLLRGGWSVTTEDPLVVVVGPDAPDFVSEVWRIARFVAYADFVSIERQAGRLKEYRIASRSRRGLAFEMLIRARE